MIARTDSMALLEKWTGGVEDGDSVVVELGDAVVVMVDGSPRGVLEAGRHASEAGAEYVFVKAQPLVGMRAGGALTVTDPSTGVALSPRVMLEYNVRIADPTTFAIGMVSGDGDAAAGWIKSNIMQAIKGWLEEHGVMDALSGAWDLAAEATPLVNAELDPLGVEVTVTNVMLSLSEDDREALTAAVEAAAAVQSGE